MKRLTILFFLIALSFGFLFYAAQYASAVSPKSVSLVYYYFDG